MIAFLQKKIEMQQVENMLAFMGMLRLRRQRHLFSHLRHFYMQQRQLMLNMKEKEMAIGRICVILAVCGN